MKVIKITEGTCETYLDPLRVSFGWPLKFEFFVTIVVNIGQIALMKRTYISDDLKPVEINVLNKMYQQVKRFQINSIN